MALKQKHNLDQYFRAIAAHVATKQCSLIVRMNYHFQEGNSTLVMIKVAIQQHHGSI